MPFQAVPQGVQVKLLMTQNDVKMENVWNVDAGVPVTPVVLAGIGAIFDGWVTTDYSILQSTSIRYNQIICTDISVANGAQDIRVPATTNGANGTGQVAGNAALVASLRTIHTGKNFRGRTYTPGMVIGATADAQHVTPTYAAAVNVQFVNLLGLLTLAGYKLCVLSRFLHNALRAIGLLTEIVSIVTDTKIDSQQRRTSN